MDDDKEENVDMAEGDMDDDDEDDDAVEMATGKIESHAGPVSVVSAFVHTQQEAAESGVEQQQPQPQISISTGGGDDKAFLHRVTVLMKSMETSNPNRLGICLRHLYPFKLSHSWLSSSSQMWYVFM